MLIKTLNVTPLFYRVGSGTQYTKDKDGNLVKVAGGYALKQEEPQEFL